MKNHEGSHYKLIDQRQRIRNNVEKQSIRFIMSGHVRWLSVLLDGQQKLVFNEKGIDVKTAVDMITLACDKAVDTVVLCSSDSNLYPAVKEAKKER